ncbi:MAG: ABC transporter permease subunit [Clostridium sp.]|nr:MAG: ABC transporter permease subunit [Clostridium sp.]
MVLIGVIIFISFVNKTTGSTGGSILSGALTLSIMLLPIIIRTTEEAIKTIPKSYKSASLALGASETQTTFKIILPNAIPGILTSTLLSIGRIIGESAALIFLRLVQQFRTMLKINQGSTSLAVHIWSVMSNENPNYEQACAISIIILFVVLIFKYF